MLKLIRNIPLQRTILPVVVCGLLFSAYPLPGVHSEERHGTSGSRPGASLCLTRLCRSTQADLAEKQRIPTGKNSTETKTGTQSKKRKGGGKFAVKLGRRTTEKLRVFLDRFAPFVPKRKIEFKLDDIPSPTGFMIIRYSITSSSAPVFDRKSALLLSDDLSSVFIGHAMSLADNPANLHDVAGPKSLSAYFSKKAGTAMKISWKRTQGPGGAYPAVIVVESPIGNLKTTGAITANGKWFLFGTFFPLDRDPRIERMKRLSLKGRVALGPPDAPITLVDLSDFQCPACAALQPKLEALVSKYAPEVRLVRVDLPQWRVHHWAMKAAEWSRCVKRFMPDVYWHFADAVFLGQSQINRAGFFNVINPVISALGLNTPGFQKCRNSTFARKAILDDLRRAASVGISGTPTVLVNGVLLDMDIQDALEPAVVQVRRDLKGLRSSVRKAKQHGAHKVKPASRTR